MSVENLSRWKKGDSAQLPWNEKPPPDYYCFLCLFLGGKWNNTGIVQRPPRRQRTSCMFTQTNGHKCHFLKVAYFSSFTKVTTAKKKPRCFRVTLNSHLLLSSLEIFALNIDYFQDSFHSQQLRFRLYDIERPQNKASELPGSHPRRHGVVGCGGPFMTLVTPAHLGGRHGPATTVTKPQKWRHLWNPQVTAAHTSLKLEAYKDFGLFCHTPLLSLSWKAL